MKKKITLGHLAPYLPYGLKVYVYGQTRFEDYTCKIERLDHGGQVYFSHEWNNIDNSEYFKPILRPLSDLTKEVTHNEKTFVPIIELAKEFHIPSKYSVTHYGDIKDYGYVGVKVNCYVENSSSRYFEFSIHSDELILHNDYRIVQKLAEWHFDVFGLIDQNLAININEVKEEKD